MHLNPKVIGIAVVLFLIILGVWLYVSSTARAASTAAIGRAIQGDGGPTA